MSHKAFARTGEDGRELFQSVHLKIGTSGHYCAKEYHDSIFDYYRLATPHVLNKSMRSNNQLGQLDRNSSPAVKAFYEIVLKNNGNLNSTIHVKKYHNYIYFKYKTFMVVQLNRTKYIEGRA